MKTLRLILGVTLLLWVTAVGAQAENPVSDTQKQLYALQKQVQVLQEQSQQQIKDLQAKVDTLQQQLTKQGKGKNGLIGAIQQRNLSNVPLIGFGTPYRLRKEEDLENESPINISGEVALQYKTESKSGSSSDEGFRAYELPELFIDATVNDYISAFVETSLLYEGGGIEVEDAWVDIHAPLELAAAGDTGVKIGQFHAPFGWDNDDNEGYVYGGRTSVDSSYVRSQRLDGNRLRDRQIGLQANYKLKVDQVLDLDTEDPVDIIFTGAVLNGDGGSAQGNEWDNDNQRDWVARVEGHFLNAVLGSSMWYAPATKNITADVNGSRHTRNLYTYGVHFKYPDVPTPGEDMTLGDSMFLIWGEWIWRAAEEANILNEGTTRTNGGYIEADLSFSPTLGDYSFVLVPYARAGYYDPNTTSSNDLRRLEGTFGVKWEFMSNCELNLEYVVDDFKGATDGDHFAIMLKTKF